MHQRPLHFLLLLPLLAAELPARPDYGNLLGSRNAAGEVVYGNRGLPLFTNALEPVVQRWYSPASLFAERHSQWGGDTNYARESFFRYVSRDLEGEYFYDYFGNLVTRGWMIYDWRQVQPEIDEASRVFKSGEYVRWFNRQVLAVDSRGDYSFSIIAGDELHATLTPMTFRKAGFNGVMTNLATSRFRVTGLFSRISAPLLQLGDSPPLLADRRINATNLAAGRGELDLAPGFALGVNLVSSSTSNGTRESFEGNPFKGDLASGQLVAPGTLLIRLSDDSPEDGAGGAVLVRRDIEIATKIRRPSPLDPSVGIERDTLIVGSAIGFDAAEVRGGKLVDGLLTADGADAIVLRYVLAPEQGAGDAGSLQTLLQQPPFNLTLTEAVDAVEAIERVRFRLVLANDYRVEMSSDLQAGAFGVPQFRLVTRAPGNVGDQVNTREIVFDYGLPTGNLIYGVSAEIRDFHGFDFYGEVNANSSYRKYPAPRREDHRAIAGIAGEGAALAWMANLSWQRDHFSAFVEGFGMSDGYTTSVRPVGAAGAVDYSPGNTVALYDYVDDNDDDDRHPDQKRFIQGSLVPLRLGQGSPDLGGVADPEVFPGYDENGDFISDFNQNHNPVRQNLFPDYDEPFLRYGCDRPEFLFGLDLNNNGWIDRFENDHLPDYPYKKDRWGYNGYGSLELTPEAELTLGRLDEESRMTGQENRTTYAILTAVKDMPGRGKLRMFGMARQAADGIHDHLAQWIARTPGFGDPGEDPGSEVGVPDPLAARDTSIRTLYADWEHAGGGSWRTFHRVKYESWHQRADDSGGRTDSGFFGLIDKAEYRRRWGRVTVSPKLKSEYLAAAPFELGREKRQSWDMLLFLQAGFPLFRTTRIEAGIEQRFFHELRADEDLLAPGDPSGDFRGTVLAAQLQNSSTYLGYRMIMQIGMRWDRRSLEIAASGRQKRASGLVFVSVFGGL